MKDTLSPNFQNRLYVGALTLSNVMNRYGDGFSPAYKCIKDTSRVSMLNYMESINDQDSTLSSCICPGPATAQSSP